MLNPNRYPILPVVEAELLDEDTHEQVHRVAEMSLWLGDDVPACLDRLAHSYVDEARDRRRYPKAYAWETVEQRVNVLSRAKASEAILKGGAARDYALGVLGEHAAR